MKVIKFREIIININYEQQIDTFRCKPNEKIINILLAFASKRNINFNQINFLFDGRTISKTDYEKTVSQFVTTMSEGIITLLAFENTNLETEERELLKLNEKSNVVFWFNNQPTEINCLMNSSIGDVTEAFSKEAKININLLNFEYQGQKLDLNKNFYEMANQIDKKRKRIDIFVQDINEKGHKNKNDRNNESFFKRNKRLIIIIIIIILTCLIIIGIIALYLIVINRKKENEVSIINSTEFIDNTHNILETNRISTTDKIIETNQIISSDKIAKTNKSIAPNKIIKTNIIIPNTDKIIDKIIETNIIIPNTDKIIGTNIIIPNTERETEIKTYKIIETEKSYLTEKIKYTNNIIETEEIKKTDKIISTNKCNDRCDICNSENINECLSCKENFDLIGGECLPYAFSATYSITRYYEELTIFNSKRFYDIYAMKIEGNIIRKTTKYTFPERKKYTVYYYLIEKEPVSLTSMFEGIGKLIDFSFNKKYINNFYIKDMKRMFASCYSLEKLSIDFTNINTKYLKEIDYLFYNINQLSIINLSNLIEKSVTNISYMFYNCNNLKEIHFNNFNTQNVVNMSYMFCHCKNLESLDLSSFNTEKVSHMQHMFSSCNKLTSLNISSFNTKNVINMKYMFSNCNSLTSINSNNIFNSKKVNDISGMFCYCKSLVSLDLSKMDTSKVTVMYWTFKNCESLTYLDISNFNYKNVQITDGMFSRCYSLQEINLPNFIGKKVTSFSSMFYECKSLTSLDLSKFNPENPERSSEMFYYCESLKYLDISSLVFKSNAYIFSSLANNCTIKINKRSDTKITIYPTYCNIIWMD